MGLVVDREGFPIAHEIFDGNTQDRATLGRMLDALAVRVGLKEGATVVVDRGMAFDDNLAELRARGLHYVVAARQSERDRFLADYEDEDGFEEVVRDCSPNNESQKKTRVRVKLRRTDQGTRVLCTSDGRVLKDRAIRVKQEQRMRADLDKLAAACAGPRAARPAAVWERIGRIKERYPRVARYFHVSYDAETSTLTCERDEERVRKAEDLDGSYLLKTDRTDLTADEAWRIYSLLTRAEQAFRDRGPRSRGVERRSASDARHRSIATRGEPLAERPIFHHKSRRVDTHVFLCVLAYHLLVAIETTLRSAGIFTSWATVRDALASHVIATAVLPTAGGQVLHIRRATRPESEHLRLYKALGIDPHIIKPRRWLTDPPAPPSTAPPS